MQISRLAHGIVGSPKVSGDGSTVVWNQVVGDNLELMRYRDGQVDQLTHDPRADMRASLSHDGSVVAWTRFSSTDPTDKTGHWDIVVNRNGQETVLAGSRANEMDAYVSADGKHVGWSSDTDGTASAWKVVVDGQDVTGGEGNNAFPQLNADGSRIVWRNFSDTGSDLWLRDQNGTCKQLTDDPENEVKPAFTPDGKTLVYSKDRDLFRHDLEPSKVTVLADDPQMDELWPAVSDDGQKVVWTNFDKREDKVDTQIWLREGGQNAPLTSMEGLSGFPSISGDGSKVAWMWVDREDLGDTAIYLADFKKADGR